MSVKKTKKVIAWEEWCALPILGIPAIKFKADTGAKTSALYALNIAPFLKNGQNYVAFQIHPIQRNKKILIQCSAPLIDFRYVTSSTGQKEKRYVIQTIIRLNEKEWPIELTLAKRTNLAFRMLLGREAIRKGKLIVDPAKSYVLGKIDIQTIKTLYQDVISTI